jgi:hypothetical protein
MSKLESFINFSDFIFSYLGLIIVIVLGVTGMILYLRIRFYDHESSIRKGYDSVKRNILFNIVKVKSKHNN